jgi:hypothetical protein
MKFTNFVDVMRQKVCSEQLCVWPLLHFESDEAICAIQLEHGKSKQFKLESDRKILQTVTMLARSILS